jgi:NAD(P)-dependent dehydrogenase (short-subunit alcohol dehydrogenase family)
MLSCREVLKHMIPQRTGAIINIVSLAGTAGDGKSGFPLRSAYCAAKMGLIGITETLAIEVGEYNIRVNAVSPGPVKGEHITNAMMGKARATKRPFEEIMKDLAAGSSLKRISEEAEVASAVVFLASDEASAITGQTLPVSCGQHINF